MKLSIIHAGFFKLDGGAMFGVVPKKIWGKYCSADENNMCTWAARCLLLETYNRKILFDTGIGNKQDERFRSHFEPHGPFDLISSLKNNNVNPEDITDVFLTHLHFDHCGGAMTREEGEPVPQFRNARYWTNRSHFESALEPNEREKASFLKENFMGLQEKGVLEFIDETQGIEWIPGINIQFFFGHTESMMVPIITLEGGRKIAFCADLLPSSYHIKLPYVMSYDIRPLLTLQEKKDFYEFAIKHNIYCIFEHDPIIEGGFIGKDEKERFHFRELKPLFETL